MSISQDPSKKVRAEMQAKIKNVSKDWCNSSIFLFYII